MQNYVGDAIGYGTEVEGRMLYVDIQYQKSLKPWSRPTFPWSL